MLTIDELIFPLRLSCHKCHHDEASGQEEQDSKEGGLSDAEQDYQRIQHSAKGEGQGVHDCHFVRVVLLKSVEESLVSEVRLNCVLQLHPQGSFLLNLLPFKVEVGGLYHVEEVFSRRSTINNGIATFKELFILAFLSEVSLCSHCC